MYYSRRKPMEEIPKELTAIWSCINEECNGWMRDNFVFLSQPTCVQCQSLMEKGERMLSIVANTSPNQSKD
ncbi:cold-shock protein [Paenibacillus sp. M1]|uniref:Cold-shock protein n=1 Tax=Paenibacillus haidiansis TaxID=1574488 RepID=A0ABU7W0E2_9BACL